MYVVLRTDQDPEDEADNDIMGLPAVSEWFVHPGSSFLLKHESGISSKKYCIPRIINRV